MIFGRDQSDRSSTLVNNISTTFAAAAGGGGAAFLARFLSAKQHTQQKTKEKSV
jgi:hypothetical protein